MFPKGKLLALVAVFAAIGLITASGAFSTVQADRQADVSVAGDSNALLELDTHNQSSFATTSGDGDEVQISLADGVNTNATTVENGTLNITNNGDVTVDVEINATTSTGTVVFYNSSGQYLQNPQSDEAVSRLNGSASYSASLPDNAYVINYSNDAHLELPSGEKATVGLYINTNDVDAGASIFPNEDAITIVANNNNATAN